MDIKISLSNPIVLKGHKKPKQKVPLVENPIPYYNQMYKQLEPEEMQSGLSFNIFGSLFKTRYAEPQTVTETQKVYKCETKVVTKSEQIVEKVVEANVQPALTIDSLKKAEVNTKKLSLKTTFFKTSGLAVKTATAAVKTLAYPLTLSVKGVKMLYEKISEVRVEHKRNLLYKQMELQVLQDSFEKKLKQYKNMFSSEDMKPNFVKYNLFRVLSYKHLDVLNALLISDISRQREFLNVKSAIREGADGYNGNRGGCSDAIYALKEICPQRSEYYDCKDYKQELKRLCKIYIENSKGIERPLKNFNEIIKNFFAKNSEKLREIYDIQSDKVIKLLERIPKLGIIPKGLRVYEQWNLANCIIKDFRAVTDKHVYYGMHKAALKYDEQYKTIINFAERHRMAFDKNNTAFTDKMLEIIEKEHSDREKVYSKLYDRFITGGCNMKKICKKTKLRGGANLAKKTILTLMPFVC